MDKLEKLIEMFKKYWLIKKFYGKIEISVEAGNIVNVKIAENIKL